MIGNEFAIELERSVSKLEDKKANMLQLSAEVSAECATATVSLEQKERHINNIKSAIQAEKASIEVTVSCTLNVISTPNNTCR